MARIRHLVPLPKASDIDGFESPRKTVDFQEPFARGFEQPKSRLCKSGTTRGS